MKRLMWSLLLVAGCSSPEEAGPNPASGANVYYLNFEGQTLTGGVEDPSLNRSQLISGTVSLPAYLAGDPQRTTKIAALVQGVTAILAPYDIAIVTTRPASGAYDMAVLGGTSQQAGFPVGLPGAAAVDCTGARPRYTSFVFDLSLAHDAARHIIGSLGVSHAISASTANTDCMCISDGSCSSLAAACTLGGANTPVSPTVACEAPGVTTMNVQQRFLATFGEHP